MNCPKCDGPTWDNRTSKTNPKAPDYKCKDKECGGAIWLDVKKPKPGARVPLSEPHAVTHTNGSILDQRQRAIIRQHSQSMALEVLKLKVQLNELSIEDLTPAKLTKLAEYFDSDVLGIAQ